MPTAKSSHRRTQERTEATRNKLLEAAAVLFTEHGFEGVTIRDLENAADVQRGLLSYHFGDKETLTKDNMEQESVTKLKTTDGAE